VIAHPRRQSKDFQPSGNLNKAAALVPQKSNKILKKVPITHYY
jgi:hypothetical protein